MSPLELPTREEKVFWYLGVDGNLARGSSGNLDLGEAVEFVALTNAYAPAGIGGEAIFVNLRLSLFRDNATDMVLDVVPIIDGIEQDLIELDLPGVAAPARSIHELGLASYFPSALDPQISTALRGTWFQAEIRSPGPPESVGVVDGRFVFEGLELEFEVVEEGRQAANANP